MKFSKNIIATAALIAVATFSLVEASSYLARAKQAAADAAAKAKNAAKNLAAKAQDSVDNAQIKLSQAKDAVVDAYNDAKVAAYKMGTRYNPSNAVKAIEIQNMNNMRQIAEELGINVDTNPNNG